MPTKKNSPAQEPADLAKAVESVAEELRPLYKIEETNDALGELASALHHLAHAQAMSVIAEFGSEKDRATAVEYLKRQYERGIFEEE